IDRLPGLDGHADLLAVLGFEAHARRLAVGAGDADLRYVHRRLAAVDTALRVGLARLAVTGRDLHARDEDLLVLGHHLQDGAGAALVLAGADDDSVTLLDLRGSHHSTSGAS